MSGAAASSVLDETAPRCAAAALRDLGDALKAAASPHLSSKQRAAALLDINDRLHSENTRAHEPRSSGAAGAAASAASATSPPRARAGTGVAAHCPSAGQQLYELVAAAVGEEELPSVTSLAAQASEGASLPSAHHPTSTLVRWKPVLDRLWTNEAFPPIFALIFHRQLLFP
ncbi:hypothetical protein EON68_04305, partial [archaeon]